MKPLTRRNAARSTDGQSDKTLEPVPDPASEPGFSKQVTDLTNDEENGENNKNQIDTEKDLAALVNSLKNDMAKMKRQHVTQLALINAQLKQVQKERNNLLVFKQPTLLAQKPLHRLTGDFSSTMTNLVTAKPNTTFPKLIQEIKNFMGIHFLEQEARQALSDEFVIQQKQTKSVSTFFQDADVSEMKWIHKFYGGLRPTISHGITGISFATVDALRYNIQEA
ncbi:hypothetical protein KEM56_000553, partial [Ascosphaera pollenicola]